MSTVKTPKYSYDRDQVAKDARKESLAPGTLAMWMPVKDSIRLVCREEAHERFPETQGTLSVEMKCLPLAVEGDAQSATPKFGVFMRLDLPIKNTETLTNTDGSDILEDGKPVQKYPNHVPPTKSAWKLAAYVSACGFPCDMPEDPRRVRGKGWCSGDIILGSDNAAEEKANEIRSKRNTAATEFILQLIENGQLAAVLSKGAFYANLELKGESNFPDLKNVRATKKDDETYGPVGE